jgi:hypothetical protein
MLSSVEFSTTEKKQGHGRRRRSSATHESRQANHNEVYLMIQVPPIMEKGRPEEGKL